MKSLITALLIATTANAYASKVEVSSCNDHEIGLQNIYGMRSYSNESVKVFKIDLEEPSLANVGIAVSIRLSDFISSDQSICRFIPGLTDADFKSVKFKYDKSTDTITLNLKASQSDEEGVSQNKLLTIVINKAFSVESESVLADLK